MADPSLRPLAAEGAGSDSRNRAAPTLLHPEGAAVPPPAAAPDFAAATGLPEVGTFGRYRVLQKLGRGGMGAVYLGHDTALDRRVALKVMLPDAAKDPEARGRFLREARSAAKVCSEHVVTIFDVGEERNIPFIAMEYLHGMPLDQFLKTRGDLPLPQVIRIARETVLGLAAAHDLGLVHRDVKPGNVWLKAPRGRVKILDFGLVRAADEDVHLTGTGAVMGTPTYMSPEQARGWKVDHRTDLFSLGVMLYRLVTGRTPFTGDTTMAVLTSLAVDAPVPPRQLNAELPEALEAVITRLLAKNPGERFQTAREVIDALAEIENPGSGVLSVSVSVVQPPTGGAPAQNVWEEIDTSVSVAVPLDTPVITERVPRSGSRPRARPAEPVVKWPAVAGGAAVIAAVAVLLGVVLWPKRPRLEVVRDRAEVQQSAPGEKLAPPKLTPAPVVPPPAQAGPDDLAARYVLSIGGTVKVDGEKREIKAAADLPKERFRLTAIDLADNESVTDAGLAVFKGCKDLMHLNLSDTNMTDAGLAHFKECTRLTELDLAGTEVTDAGLAHFKGCMGLTQLKLEDTTVSDEGLAHFKGCKGLLVLLLNNTRVTDEGLAVFKDCRKLIHLNLSDTNVTDAGLVHFRDCTELQILELKGTGVTDKGLAHFEECTGLIGLDLGNTQVTDEGLAHFKECTKLTLLYLDGTGVTDEGLAHFARCRSLEHLNLSGTGVGDDGLAHFREYKRLTKLDLSGTKVTDAGLVELKGHKSLSDLDVRKTKITPAGVEEFRKARPRCNIKHGGGGEPKK